MSKQKRAYGTWPSSLSPHQMAGTLRLNDVQWDNVSDTLVWLEGRGDRGVLVMQAEDEAARDLTSDLSVRARVGYGGGDFTVAHGHVYFAGPDGRLFRQALSGGGAQPITPAFGHAAAPRVSADGQWLVYVHTYEGRDGLALVDTRGSRWPVKLAYGTDFVMQPAWHPQGTHAAYIAWDHPLMPWDGTELRLIQIVADDQGTPQSGAVETLAGDEHTAIFQPEFSPDGRHLAYVSDASGWGQLYLYDLQDRATRQITRAEAEHAEPAWVQGVRVYTWAHDGQSIFFLRNERGLISLWRYHLGSDNAIRISQIDGYTSLSQVAASAQSDRIALIGSASQIPARILTYTLEPMPLPEALAPNPDTPSVRVLVKESPGGVRIIRRSSSEQVLPGQLSVAQAMTWTGHDGETVHGLYSPPTSDQYQSVGLPPLIVQIHGGPTSQVTAGYNGRAQFFTSRGFAVLEVNYRGSTGYGRDYMLKLRSSWGLYDVEDAASGAAHLVEQGLADRARLVIMGGSAGGFTVYQSLIDKPGFYKAGICLYGVANQFGLAMETHKFEERYSDSLLGPLPEAADLYRARSPFFHADKIVDPIAIYQGEIDQVVPRNQSDDMVASLRARGVPHVYEVYEGEGHGWRKPETIETFYTSVLRFLQQYVVFA
ncbi:MAG: S9 family peptidase [Anaerolineae bacterium]|nr:S9 family peptidase [Anaerolineae bacterium]